MTSQSDTQAKIAYIFPGQGSQAVGMGYELYKTSPAARAIFDEADDALGVKLTRICFEGTEEELRQTVNAQPALLTASVATMASIAEARGSKPGSELRFVAGHSVGEYAALVAAEALPFREALRMVRERGQLMHKAGQVREGAMAAVLGLDMAAVEQLCQETGAEIANVNCDGQIVISGSKQALVRAIDLSRALGARKAIPLVVSGAFHSSLMKPAVAGMERVVKAAPFQDPAVPIISNLTARPIVRARDLPQELVQQICSCVRWSKSVEYMASNGVSTFVEVGPGKVLTALVKRIAPAARSFSVGDLASVRSFAG